MKKVLLFTLALAMALPVFSQGLTAEQQAKKDKEFDKMYRSLTFWRGEPKVEAPKKKSSWELKEEEIQKKAQDAKFKQEQIQHKESIYTQAENSLKRLSPSAKQHYDNLIASGNYKNAIKDMNSVAAANSDEATIAAIKYYIVRQAVIHYGTDILSNSLPVAQAVLNSVSPNRHDFVYYFANQVESKCHKNDTKPFPHLKNADLKNKAGKTAKI